jgi:hypothetical protein
MYRRLIVAALGTLAFALAPASQAGASEAIEVEVAPIAQLLPDGSVNVTIAIRCAPFGQHFESNLTLTQDGGAIFAQPGLRPVICDNTWHAQVVRATPFDGSFHRGSARASAFVSRVDPVTGEERQGSDVEEITINAPPDCSRVRPDRAVLSHTAQRALERVRLSGATDPDGNPVWLQIWVVQQDETLTRAGDDPSTPDAQLTSFNGEVLIRAERHTAGDGRIYAIRFRGGDGRGGICSGTAFVSVPRFPGTPAVDSGLRINSLKG